MIVTELKRNIKFKKLTEVYIDFEYAFSLYDNELREFGIFAEKCIDEEDLDKIFIKLKKNAINAALRMISRSDHTTMMVADKLSLRKYPLSIIENTIEYINEKGFTYDLQYAKDFTKSAFGRGKGRKYVEFELKKRGIDDKTIKTLTMEYDLESKLRELAESKLLSILKGRINPDFKDFSKMRDYLLRQGFDFDEVADAVSYVKGKYYD